MKTSKWLCAILVAVLAIGGPLAPLTAMGQMQAPPPPPPPPSPAPIASAPYEPTEGDRVGAGFLNVVYVPGKVIICSAGTVASAVLMLLTFGNAYHAAVGVFKEGCGGSWVLTPYDVAQQRAPEEQSY